MTWPKSQSDSFLARMLTRTSRPRPRAWGKLWKGKSPEKGYLPHSVEYSSMLQIFARWNELPDSIFNNFLVVEADKNRKNLVR